MSLLSHFSSSFLSPQLNSCCLSPILPPSRLWLKRFDPKSETNGIHVRFTLSFTFFLTFLGSDCCHLFVKFERWTCQERGWVQLLESSLEQVVWGRHHMNNRHQNTLYFSLEKRQKCKEIEMHFEWPSSTTIPVSCQGFRGRRAVEREVF